MAPKVKLGPVPLVGKSGLSPMMKEISQRKCHIDLVFYCDDGCVHAQKFVLGAQSKVTFFMLYLSDAHHL